VTLAQWRTALRWRIAQETGWTLATIDGLSLGDIWEYLSVRDGLGKAAASAARKGGG